MNTEDTDVAAVTYCVDQPVLAVADSLWFSKSRRGERLHSEATHEGVPLVCCASLGHRPLVV